MSHPSLKDFHPLVAQWFETTFGEPTPPQAEGWPVIAAGENVLLLAPTGSGKTLAAFLKVIDRLYQEMARAESPAKTGVKILYISPLKALNNDINRNLEEPLQGIKEFSAERGAEFPGITRAVRSGDTPGAERQRMLRRPPQILITTPESLFLMLSSKASQILKTVRCVIVDEIHTLFTEKRGAHLALSLERLQNLVEKAAGRKDRALQRIGLSATIRPLPDVAAFLGGFELDPKTKARCPRPVTIIDTGQRKELDLQITLPVPNLRELPERTIWPSIYQKVTDLVRQHRTTLVFVNNRRLAERVTANLNKIAGKELARTHHGSLAREIRLEVEQKLKSGALPCVVATASLELGIDIGDVDLVIQLESPKEVARGLQRVGRAGHVINKPSKGRIIPKNRADLLEAVALVQEMKTGRVEIMKAPMNCLDILAQQLVAMTATGDVQVDQAYQLVRSAYNYHNLSRADLDRVLAMLNGSYETQAYLDLRPRLFWDRTEGVIKADPYGKRLVYTAGGTIPDRGYFSVYLAGSNLRLGELDEEFVYERRLNERFVLGTSVWRIEEIRQDRVIVTPAGKGEAQVPFWRAEQGGRSFELGKRIGAFLGVLEEKLEAEQLQAFLERECKLSTEVTKNLQKYLTAQKRAVDYLPTDHRLVIEEFPDEAGEWRLLIHSTLGNRVNLSLALLIGAAFEEKLGRKLAVTTGDDGIMFSVQGGTTPPTIDWAALAVEGIEEQLGKELAGTALFGSIFRHCAQRSLVMPRGGFGGKRLPLWLARIKAGNLMQTVARYRDFPLVCETYREIFQDYLDLEALDEVLRGIRTGEIEIYRKQHQTPSPFAHGHLFNFVANFMYDTDRPKEGGSKHLFGLGSETLKTIVGKGGFRDLFRTEVIKAVDRKARGLDLLAKTIDAERVGHWLERCGDLTDGEIDEVFPQQGAKVREIIAALCAKGTAVRVEASPKGEETRKRWFVYREEVDLYLKALPGVITEDEKPELADPGGVDKAKKRIIQRYARTHGPFTAEELADRYGWSLPEVEEILALLASAGWVEAGEYIPGGQGEEWCDSELLREIHRRSLARTRQEIKVRTRVRGPREYAVFLARWQGVTGERYEAEGLAETLTQLAGRWIPAARWERHLLPVRVKRYQPILLDMLFSSGQFQWRARGTAESFEIMVEVPPTAKGFAPSVRVDSGPNTGDGYGGEQEQISISHLSGASRAILELLKVRGTQTLPFILREVNLSTSTLWQALEELMLNGMITNDSFGPVRYMLRTKPPARVGAQGVLQPAVMARMGRWSLVPPLALTKGRLAQGLLNRYGIVSREIAQAEGIAWQEVSPALVTMENIGQVKRGYFIQGLSGIQYALPQALAVLGVTPDRSQQYWALSWSDPANPFNYLINGLETADGKRVTGDYLVFAGGSPILTASGRRLRIQTLEPAAFTRVEKGIHVLIPSLYPAYPDQKIVVSSFDGEAAPQSRAKEILTAIGFEGGYQMMTLWPSDRNSFR